MTGKRMKAALTGVDRNKFYSVEDAVKAIKERAKAKFDETIELAFNLGIDPKQSDQNVRGVISLPHGTGKSVRVAVFAKGERAEAAKKAGADIVGADDLAEKVQAGQMDFDRVIASPDMMVLVGKLGKAPDGSRVELDLTGPMSRTIRIAIDGRAAVVDDFGGADPTTTIRLDGLQFTRLAGGRPMTTARSTAIEYSGDAEVGHRIVDNLAFVP